MIGRVRVVIYHKFPEEGAEPAEQAYHEISRKLDGTPGLLANEMLRSVLDPKGFAVFSEWENLDAFKAWEQGSGHRGDTSPLRQYQDRSRTPHFEVYEVTAAY